MKLNNVRLLVKDFDASFDFYANKLGLNVTWGKPGADYASFDIGIPSGLSIFKSDLMANAIDNKHLQLPAESREKMLLAINVENVDATYKELSGKGIQFINEPTDMTGWGLRGVHLRDPEGNLLEFWSELPREKWDKDLLEDASEYNYE